MAGTVEAPLPGGISVQNIMIHCKICGNSTDNKKFFAREMMRGTRTEFSFLECGACGTVQMCNSDVDMTAYYDNASYGSFLAPQRSGIKKLMRRIRNGYAIHGSHRILGPLLNRRNPLPPDYTVVKEYVHKSSRIIDVGCGTGAYIQDLADIGFTDVSGVDPYIKCDLKLDNGTVIRKGHFHELRESCDVLLSHHSFEHVPEPLPALIAIRNSLKEGGVCILTIPVAETLFQKYQENCYLIQAPQHPFLYTVRGFQVAAQAAGLRVERMIRDASDAATWCKYSESWKRNVAMNEPELELNKQELLAFDEEQQEMKRSGLGDNVTFILRPVATR